MTNFFTVSLLRFLFRFPNNLVQYGEVFALIKSSLYLFLSFNLSNKYKATILLISLTLYFLAISGTIPA